MRRCETRRLEVRDRAPGPFLCHSALRTSSTTFLASPNSIMVLSRKNNSFFDARIARAHAALDEQHGLGPVDIEDRHAENRRLRVRLGGRVRCRLQLMTKSR